MLDQKIPGWLIKIISLGIVETVITLGIKSRFGTMGFLAWVMPFWACGFFLFNTSVVCLCLCSCMKWYRVFCVLVDFGRWSDWLHVAWSRNFILFSVFWFANFCFHGNFCFYVTVVYIFHDVWCLLFSLVCVCFCILLTSWFECLVL